MPVTDPHPEHSAHEELVAYLDGELAPEDCRRVEDRLAVDDDYRQQLRDLDQAWEALNELPATAVDDSFARTTIELACVAAQEDLSQRTAQAAAVNSGRKRWWIAAGVAAAVVTFLMVRALAVHRNNLLLADLPVIGQLNSLTQVSDIEFLRKLTAADLADEMVQDEAEFKRTLADFTQSNANSLAERRKWVDSLTTEQKAELADQSRTFEDLRQNPKEKDRLRNLAEEIGRATDAPALQKTLVAYGEWLARHSAGEQQTISEKLAALPDDKRVAEIRKMVEREGAQSARHLSPEERTKLQNEIFAIAKDMKAKLLEKMPAGPLRDRVETMDVTKPGPARFIVTEALFNNDSREEVVTRLLNGLSGDTNEHWQKLHRWQRKEQLNQLSEWIHEAVQTKWGPEDLEEFFANDSKLTNDQRQLLLDKPRLEFEVELERLYQKSVLGIDERWQLLREFGDRARGQRNGQPPDGGRPGPQRRQNGPPFEGPPRRDGPPPDGRFGPDDGPPPFDRDRPPRDGGPRGPRPEGQPPGPPGEQPI